MLNLKAFRTLQSEDEYQAALKEVRPYFENEPDEGSEELLKLLWDMDTESECTNIVIKTD